MAPFDPAQIAPDFDAQRQALARAYQQGLINLNSKKGNLMSQYGFLNNGSFDTSGKSVDFSNLQVDPNQQHGAYRDELTSEANMLDAAQNGPDRGFSGGLSNQASQYAKQAIQGRQTTFQQNLQQQLGGLNLDAGTQAFNYGEGLQGVAQSQGEYAGGQALWEATNPTGAYTVPGASGGGSTPITPQPIAQPTGAYAPIKQGPYQRTGPETPMTMAKKSAKQAVQSGIGGMGHVT